MKPTTILTVLATAATLALSASAYAQPGAAPGASSPIDGDISHINGTPVKVGEHNEYHYSYRRFNVGTNPLMALAGHFSLDGAVAIHRHVAVRASISFFNMYGSEDGLELEASAPIYFRKVYSGFYFEPGVHWAGGADDDAVFGPQMLFGYHWNSDSGLNLSMAGGLSRNLVEEDSDYHDGYESSDMEILPQGYMRLGYNF